MTGQRFDNRDHHFGPEDLAASVSLATPSTADWSPVIEYGMEAFARATRFDDAVVALMGMLSRHFAVRECVWGEMAREGQPTIRPLIVVPEAPAIPDEAARQALARAIDADERRPGATSGGEVRRLVVDGREWSVARPAGDDRFLVWCDGDGVNVASQRRALRTLARVLAREWYWYARLDERDALIYRDDLTGLYNHRYLDLALDNELRRVTRFKTPFSVLFMDIDRFKSVNDNHGHLVGSDLLRQVAGILKAELRDVDSVIRYGGDEFVAIAVGTDARGAFPLAERIRRRVEETVFQSHGNEFRVTLSIGVAACPEHGRDKEAILKLADEHMYVGKRGGRNRVSMMGDEAFRVTGRVGGPA